ncbi:hypothetical protein HU200_051401 [Digitaria exilis]|uniref:F-box domain-containing protein n=1 Tax=Digitaria exilis TaxID=1010633 RepID=A0A835AM69_9POAL|nr:hypothetical protein HU200_051401 [Digitaria exilis]
MEEQHQQAGDDDLMTRLLPEDVLAQILCLLPPRDLAVSRCVCAEWKGAVDRRRLLRADLLPLSVGGIFINICAHCYAEFFRPRSGNVSGNLAHLLEYSRWFAGTVLGHCNGLVLLDGCVSNPATGWFAPLPPWPMPTELLYQEAHIVFDPAVSSHYSVFLINYGPLYDENAGGELQAAESQEWPPSHYPFHVFSSATERWEERPFLRQGDAVGTLADVRLGTKQPFDYHRRKRCFAAYWKQALYVHCHNNFFFRISLSRDEYRVIKPPPGISNSVRSKGLVFGKSEKGPYLAESRYADRCFKVWILDESNHNQWVLRHCNKHLGLMLPRCYLDSEVFGPWILEDTNYIEDWMCWYEEEETPATAPPSAPERALKQQSDCGCDFDEDGGFTLDSTNSPDDGDMYNAGSSFCYIDDLLVFGFHPFKEIVFLGSGIKIAVAHDLNSSKFQYMGSIYPTDFSIYYTYGNDEIVETFVYTPCKLEAHGQPPTPTLAAD